MTLPTGRAARTRPLPHDTTALQAGDSLSAVPILAVLPLTALASNSTAPPTLPPVAAHAPIAHNPHTVSEVQASPAMRQSEKLCITLSLHESGGRLTTHH